MLCCCSGLGCIVVLHPPAPSQTIDCAIPPSCVHAALLAAPSILSLSLTRSSLSLRDGCIASVCVHALVAFFCFIFVYSAAKPQFCRKSRDGGVLSSEGGS